MLNFVPQLENKLNIQILNNMKLQIKSAYNEPIIAEYANISIVESQSVGEYDITFRGVGRNGLNVEIRKPNGENEGPLVSLNRNIDVLGRKLEFVEKIVNIIATESMRRAMNGNPNEALRHVSSWLDTYFNNGGELDDDLIKIICKAIGETLDK